MGKSLIVVGALWGDEGKGKIAAHVARRGCDFAVRAGTGTNAGHSLHYGSKYIKCNQLPLAGIFSAMLGDSVLLGVGSGVCFDPSKCEDEIERYPFLKGKVFVDYRCPVILEEHKERESKGENYSEKGTGSTKSGSGEARVDMVKRIGVRAGQYFQKSSHPNILVGDVAKKVNEIYDGGGKIVVEGSQAHYLSLYLSPDYPVVTSDNCTATAFADDVGLPWNKIDDVCVVVKSAPTRVSQEVGDLPGEISVEEMERKGIVEKGVTTGRVRRKSLQIPFNMLDDVVMINQPTFFALTFCDHVDNFRDAGLPGVVKLNDLRRFERTYKNILELQRRYGVPVKYVEYGKDFSDITEIEVE